MRRFNIIVTVEIGDRPRYFEDPVVCSRAQMELLHRPSQEFLALGVQFAATFELAMRHLSVGAAFCFSGKTLLLTFSGA